MAAGALAVVVAACGEPTVQHTTLDDDIEELQRAFEADSGKVRALFLASPT